MILFSLNLKLQQASVDLKGQAEVCGYGLLWEQFLELGLQTARFCSPSFPLLDTHPPPQPTFLQKSKCDPFYLRAGVGGWH